MSQRIVILGGGFGGLNVARELERRLPPQAAQVTLVSSENFLLYTPLLPGAAAGTLDPRHVVVSLREKLTRTNLVTASVTAADPGARIVTARTPDGRTITFEYDQLVVALGSVSRLLPIPGLAEHGVGFKTLPDAIRLRNRLIQHLEIAETLDSAEERAPWLGFVFVGAGYAGLEGLAELQDFAAAAIEHYPRCRGDGMRWLLVEATDRVMPEIAPRLADFAVRELRGRGIEVLTETTLDNVTETTATLSSGEVVATRTLVWTAGVAPVPVAAQMGLPRDERGRIVADATTAVAGQDRVWAIGDVAAVPDPSHKGRACPPTAQHAMRQARTTAANVAATISGGPLESFRYRTRGVFVDLGHGQAVANAMGIRLRGVPAWLLARTYHLTMMPGAKRRLRLLVDWNVQLLFGRDMAELSGLNQRRGLPESSA